MYRTLDISGGSKRLELRGKLHIHAPFPWQADVAIREGKTVEGAHMLVTVAEKAIKQVRRAERSPVKVATSIHIHGV